MARAIFRVWFYWGKIVIGAGFVSGVGLFSRKAFFVNVLLNKAVLGRGS